MASLAGSGGGSNLKVGAHGERGAPAYKGIWGRSPQRGPGAEPLVKGLKLKGFWALYVERTGNICPFTQLLKVLKYLPNIA